jgi:mRNA interferase RelE/StbE
MARRIEFSPDAARFFALLDGPAQQRLVDLLSGLAADPSPPGHRIVKGPPPAYRVRLGGARILYEVVQGALRVMDLRTDRRIGREG